MERVEKCKLPPAPFLLKNYGIATVGWRSGKVMVLSGLVQPGIQLSFISTDNLWAICSVMLPACVQAAEPQWGRKTVVSVSHCVKVKCHLKFHKFLILKPGKLRCWEQLNTLNSK